MRNLKRALSLALASIMMLSLMVVGAGAVGTKDFTDNDKIQNTEAVNTMASLNIINGKEDGSYFDPEGIVTRAEMAKMITIALNGGKDPVLSAKLIPTYTDIKGNWAEAYIEYCTNQGIISGKGDGTFQPNATVTGTEAAKMILVAMGYDATIFKFTGIDWSVNVNIKANDAKLYDGLEGIDAAAGLTRDDAAQMIYNGISAETMARTPSLEITDGKITYTYGPSGTTLLKDKYNVDIYEGILTATGEYDLTAILETNTSDGSNKDGFVVDVDTVNNHSREQANIHGDYFKAKDTDLSDLMGQYVKVLYNEDKDILYGVYAKTDKNTVLDTNVTKVSYPTDQATKKVKIDGETYNIEDGTSAIQFIRGEAVGLKSDTYNALNSTTDRVRADNVRFIDNDGNGKFDLAIIQPVGVAEVTFVSSTSVTLSNQAANTLKSLSQKLEDINYPDEMEKSDFVLTTRDYYSDTDKLEILDKATGKVSGVKASGSSSSVLTDFQVDGDWNTVATGYTMPTVIKSGSSMDYVAVNGVIFYAKLTSAATGSKDLALVYSMSYGASGTFDANTLSAKIMLADGTKKTVTVGKLYLDINGTNQKDGTPVDTQEQAFLNRLVTYKVNNDGDYEFTLLTSNNKAGFDSVVYGADVGNNQNDNQLNNTIIADDASILLVAPNSVNANVAFSAKRLTGKEYKSIDNRGDIKFVPSSASVVIGKDADGFSRVRAAVVKATVDTGASEAYNSGSDTWKLGVFTGSNYGYLVTSSWTEEVDGTAYNVFKFWDGNDTVTMREKDSTPANLGARTVISYDVVDDETIKNVSTSGMQIGAVQAYSSSANRVTLGASGVLAGTEYKITNETVILNINDADKLGVEGDSISIARSIGDPIVGYVDNCYFRTNAGEVQVLVIDVNKNQLTNAVVSLGNSISTSDLSSALSNGNVVLASGNYTQSGTVTIPSGNTLTVNGDLTNATFTGGGTLNVTGNISDTAKVSTQVSFNSNNQTITLPGPIVKMGIVGGTIGSGSSLQYDAGQADGKALYQITVPASAVTNGTSQVKFDGALPANPTLTNNSDIVLGIDLSTSGSKVITIDKDGNWTTDNDVTTFTISW